jgi:hypothetical protein
MGSLATMLGTKWERWKLYNDFTTSYKFFKTTFDRNQGCGDRAALTASFLADRYFNPTPSFQVKGRTVLKPSHLK